MGVTDVVATRPQIDQPMGGRPCPYPAGATPTLALDMYEHAYHMDFGAQAGAWVEAFMRNINWEAVYRKYQPAMHVWKTAGLPLADKAI